MVRCKDCEYLTPSVWRIGEGHCCRLGIFRPFDWFCADGRSDLIPAADVVERKHGKWVKDADGCVCCSLCGNPCEINGITGEFLYSPYCSECGAEMR